MSDYSSVSRGPLKLKGVSLKKKKKKLVGEKALKNELVNEKEKSVSESVRDVDTLALTQEQETPFTKAELSFLKMQDKIRSERRLETASKSHRQRVEEFNRKLDEMTEHYDIPKKNNESSEMLK